MKKIHKIVNTPPINSGDPDFIEKINMFSERHKIHSIQFAHDNNGSLFREWAYITYEARQPDDPFLDRIREDWKKTDGPVKYESSIDAPDFERIVKRVHDVIFENYKKNGNDWTKREYSGLSVDVLEWEKILKGHMGDLVSTSDGYERRFKLIDIIVTASMMYEQSIRHGQSVRDE